MKENEKMDWISKKQEEVSRKIDEEYPFIKENNSRDNTLYEQLLLVESRLLIIEEEQEEAKKRIKEILPTISNVLDRDLFLDDEQYKARIRRESISKEREISRGLCSLIMTNKVRDMFVEKDMTLIRYENTLSDNEDSMEQDRLSMLSFRRAFY